MVTYDRPALTRTGTCSTLIPYSQQSVAAKVATGCVRFVDKLTTLELVGFLLFVGNLPGFATPVRVTSTVDYRTDAERAPLSSVLELVT